MFDAQVIVVGGGPGGSAAAKRCAEHGLKTLMLERYKLPREKVCGGYLMNELPRRLVKEEFGELPDSVLANPPYPIDTYVHEVGGKITKAKLDWAMPSVFRIHFDYWLNQGAKAKGAEIWDSTQVISMVEETDGYTLEVNREGKKQTLKAQFVIGADGATSTVRRSLFPDFVPRCSQCYQEWYEGDMESLYGFDRNGMHQFQLPPDGTRHLLIVGANLVQKSGFMVMEADAKMGELPETIARAHQAFKANGVDIPKPTEKRAALIPGFFKELFAGTFVPYRGNALLIGDAGGLIIPVTGEGIGTAMQSGFAAADAIIKALASGEKAEKYYQKDVNEMLPKFQKIYELVRVIRDASTQGPEAYKRATDALYKATDQLFV